MAAKNVKHFELRLGRLGLTLFTVGMAVLVFFVFLFGVQVGKNIETYPERYSRDLSTLLASFLSLPKEERRPAPAANAPPATKEEEEFNLTFYDTLARKNEGSTATGLTIPGVTPPAPSHKAFVPLSQPGEPAAAAPAPGKASATGAAAQGQIIARNHEEAQGGMTPAPATTTPEAARVAGEGKQAARAVATDVAPKDKPAAATTAGKEASKTGLKDGKAIVEKEDKVTKAKAPPSTTSHERYLIQVASYHEKDKAGKLCGKIRAMGYSAHVVAAAVPGRGTWYRVVADGFTDKAQADRVAGLLPKKLGPTQCVVRAQKQ